MKSPGNEFLRAGLYGRRSLGTFWHGEQDTRNVADFV